MNQEERQLLQGLFDRLRDSSNQARDPEVERFIGDQIRALPGATYYMSQAIIVQEQALQGSQERIAQLEDAPETRETRSRLMHVESEAVSRVEYLQRPDKGRRLAQKSVELVRAAALPTKRATWTSSAT